MRFREEHDIKFTELQDLKETEKFDFSSGSGFRDRKYAAYKETAKKSAKKVPKRIARGTFSLGAKALGATTRLTGHTAAYTGSDSKDMTSDLEHYTESTFGERTVETVRDTSVTAARNVKQATFSDKGFRSTSKTGSKATATRQNKVARMKAAIKNVREHARQFNIKSLVQKSKKVATKTAAKAGKFIVRKSGAVLVGLLSAFLPVFLILMVLAKGIGGVVDFFTGNGGSEFFKFVEYHIEEYNTNMDAAIKKIEDDYPGSYIRISGARAPLGALLLGWCLISDEETLMYVNTELESEKMVNSRDFMEIIEYMWPYPTVRDTSYDADTDSLEIELKSGNIEQLRKDYNVKDSYYISVLEMFGEVQYDSEKANATHKKFHNVTVNEILFNQLNMEASKFLEWYEKKNPGTSGQYRQNWSVVLLRWALAQTDYDQAAYPEGDATAWETYYKNKSLFYTSNYRPVPGDVVFLSDGRVGLVHTSVGMRLDILTQAGNKVELLQVDRNSTAIKGVAAPMY